MKLKSFHVENFRSIKSSGDIPVDDITALVGRNESGKSNLLLALETLNPITGRKDLDRVKNFPHGRHLNECKPETPVVSTIWTLTDAESQELGKLFPGHAPITEVEITRAYSVAQTSVGLHGLQPPILEPAKIKGLMRRVSPAIEAVIRNFVDPHLEPATAALAALKEATSKQDDAQVWGTGVIKTAKVLRGSFGSAGIVLDEAPDAVLAELEELAERLSGFEAAHGKARSLALGWVPPFVYITDFPDLSGHMNLAEFMQRRSAGAQLTEAETNFIKLAKVSGFDPQSLTQYSYRRLRVLRGVGRVVARWQSRTKPHCWRWFSRSPWRGDDSARAMRRCVRSPSVLVQA